MQAPSGKASLLVWWILWFGILSGMLTFRIVLAGQENDDAVEGQVNAWRYLAIVPLAISSLLRWLVLPRLQDRGNALVVYIAGLALAEGSGLLGLFLGGVLRESFFVLGVLGVLQWMPLFSRRFLPSEAPARNFRIS
jgi:hypothetical protein